MWRFIVALGRNPFTKFAHTIYRPVALFFYALARDNRTQDT